MKKRVIGFALVLALLAGFAGTVYATAMVAGNLAQIGISEPTNDKVSAQILGPSDLTVQWDSAVQASPIRADEIVTYYRRYNNWLQMRRWNATRAYWVDPVWTTIGYYID